MTSTSTYSNPLRPSLRKTAQQVQKICFNLKAVGLIQTLDWNVALLMSGIAQQRIRSEVQPCEHITNHKGHCQFNYSNRNIKKTVRFNPTLYRNVITCVSGISRQRIPSEVQLYEHITNHKGHCQFNSSNRNIMKIVRFSPTLCRNVITWVLGSARQRT